jgi:transposase
MTNATGRPIAPLILSADERAYLERQVRRHRVARSLSERCRVILRCADGVPSKSVASEIGVHEHTVGKWRRHFLKDRIDGLLDEARPGRPRTINDDQVAAVIERTLRSTPKDATHWSIRSMATETGFSRTTIRRIWNAFGLQPHRSETFKLSRDPLFVDKVRDIVSLYLSRPNRALVLSVDEKSQIQALDREQPVLPMMPGVPERRTHSYIRHGTTSLFAALDIASGFVIGKCYKRHRATEFLDFLKQIDARVPEGLDIHIIMDNYATHKTAVIKNWLARRPQYHVHFTPTSGRGSIRLSAGSPNSLASKSVAASIRQRTSSKRISAPSSSGTMKIPSHIGGPNPQMKSSPPSNASARKQSRLYVANFRFT